MKKASIILLMLFLMGCMEDPQETIQNGNFQIELLFEQDGCKMYRFKDGGKYIYWSNCQGKVQYDTGGKHNTHIQVETGK